MTNARPTYTSAERTDIVVIGSGFGGAIAAYHLAAGGAKVVVLERGPWVPSDEFDHGFELGTSSTRKQARSAQARCHFGSAAAKS